MSLNGVTYNWNENTPDDFDKEKAEVGLIAQEVQAVLPEIIHPAPFDRDPENDGKSISGEDYITLQYERVVPLLVEAIKELKEEINTLKGDA
jgi:type II restriction/modification system DNA methylase subunit YeeA